MNRLHLTLALLCSTLLLGPLATRGRADEWNEKTILTFSEPVEVPGAVLPAGKYVFKLMDSQSNRHIVEITNPRGNHVVATVLAISNERLRPTGKTRVTFWETTSGQPKPMRAWFYPGNNIGQEFAYPKARSGEIEAMNHEKVPTVPAEMESKYASNKTQTTTQQSNTATNTMPATRPAENAPVIEKSTPSNNTETAQVNPPAQPPAVNEPAPAAPAPVERLPQTASNLPLMALLGVILLALPVAIRVAVKQHS
jgi:hypothetical protein